MNMIKEPTFRDIFRANNIPFTDDIKAGLTFFDDLNVEVFGESLPCMSPGTTFISLNECNVDWFPFFGSIKNANNFFSFLVKTFNIPYHKYRGSNLHYILGEQRTGIIFSPSKNQIRVFFEYKPCKVYDIPVGSMMNTPTEIMRSISIKRDLSKVKHRGMSGITPNNYVLGQEHSLNWNLSGHQAFNQFDPKLINLVYQSFSRNYGHEMSRLVPVNYPPAPRNPYPIRFYNFHEIGGKSNE